MKVIDLVPTRHLYSATKRGKTYRMWRGKTDGGIDVWMYVYAIYPASDESGSVKALKDAMPEFMSVDQDMARTYVCDGDE